MLPHEGRLQVDLVTQDARRLAFPIRHVAPYSLPDLGPIPFGYGSGKLASGDAILSRLGCGLRGCFSLRGCRGEAIAV